MDSRGVMGSAGPPTPPPGSPRRKSRHGGAARVEEVRAKIIPVKGKVSHRKQVGVDGEGNGNPLQYSCQRIPWTGEPGGLLSMGSHRVRHD